MKPAVGTRSSFADDAAVTAAAVDRHEHESNIRRLRVALSIAPVLWLVAGVPSDSLLATMSGRSPAELLTVRAIVAVALLVGLMWLRPATNASKVKTKSAPQLSRNALSGIELFVFGSLAAGAGVLVALDRGVSSATTSLLSCILLAQGIALPRPWRDSVFPLGFTASVFVVIVAIACADELDNPEKRTLFYSTLYIAGCSLILLVVGGHATWAVRRLAFEARQIGRYRLKSKLGQGGMGEVWRAYHPGLKRDVALKVMRGARSPAARERFLVEVEAMSRLSHPNTVRVLDRGVADGDQWYYAMEIVDGRTLKMIVDDEGLLSPARAVHIAQQAARALAEAHDKGVVHCDLKPENILIASVGSDRDFVKVCDFGIASISDPATLTTTNPNGAGSVLYGAPEQLSGADVDARADVFSLGAVLHFALSGGSPAERIALPDTIDEDVRAVIARCLARDPAERFADAREVAAALASTSVADRWPWGE